MNSTMDVSNNTVIMADKLRFNYGKRIAVNDLTFSVQQGEVVGLLGPNGAGKTTTVRILNGLLKPTNGSIRVLDYDPVTKGEELRRKTGVLTETPALYERLTARQNLQFFGTVAGMSDDVLKTSIEEILGMFELAERGNDKVSTYSKGMKQRLAIGRALLHHPELLFLDEPTSGLDPEASQQVLGVIDSLRRKNGHTVLLCTHNLLEAQRLCDRVVIMHRGRLLAIGALDELRKEYSVGCWVKLCFVQTVTTEQLQNILNFEGVKSLETLQDNGFRVQIHDQKVIPSIVERLVNGGLQVMEVSPEEQSLEDIYFKLQQDAEEVE
jgi:ABC-2 type transport system ATP-binding protein